MNTLSFKLPDDFIQIWKQIDEPGAIHTSETCLLANDSFVSLFGYNRQEEVEGHPMGTFLAPWPLGKIRLGRREVLGRHRNGSTMDIKITSMPLLCSEGRILYQTLVRDVSRLKSWEGEMIQSERLTAMGKLAGEIAHEINNPLGGILLYANLIKEDLSRNSQALGNLKKIIKLATRCRIIAKGLLNFGKSDRNPLVPVDLNQVIREMYSLIEDHKIFKWVRVDMRLDRDLPHFMGNKGQIEQVVINLLINAGEAMNGKGRLLISSARDEQSRKIRLVVEDSGPGIPEDIIPRMFEPFFTRKPHGKGTGLGLSIVHGIVKRHCGKISVHSRPGCGARFEILLPVDGCG
ncbi:MAG TPA: hypothetical protein EYP57_01085 [Thermodesulfobacteriaceae bacterium]|nr:hypothetical protein [Thermodesulfobacteriaceae bacterium]